MHHRGSRAAGRMLVAALLTAAAGCGGVTQPTTSPVPGTGAAGVPGFDLRIHPGADALAAWREHGPYRWVGYYLPAPCHTGRSWVGQRAALAAQGWGLAVLFVGEQDWGAGAGAPPEGAARCTRANLTAEYGALHAAEADSVARAEGFQPGTIIFLDVEAVDQVASALQDYVRAWTEGLLAGGRYRPGLYAHAGNVEALHASMSLASARAGGGDPPLWVVRSVGDFDLAASPAASGIGWADVWQGVLDTRETWGGVTLTVDRNVARSANPSGGRPRP